MTSRELEEYRALRETIRERGTARHWIVLVGFGLWASLTLTAVVVTAVPVATLLPLFVLAVMFEVIFALHTGVERVGRYLQVYFENPDETARWEHVAMSYGREFGGGGIDALFTPIFWAATVLNFIPVMLSGTMAIDWTVVGVVHLLFVARVWSGRRQAGRQRAIDLQRFTKLKSESGG